MPTENILSEVMKLHSKTDQLSDCIEHMDRQLNHVVHLLEGHTDPSKGIIVRLDRIEQDKRKTGWLVKTAVGAAIAALTVSGLGWVFHTPAAASEAHHVGK